MAEISEDLLKGLVKIEDNLIDDDRYLVTKELSIADIVCWCTLSTIMDDKKFSHLQGKIFYAITAAYAHAQPRLTILVLT